MNEILWLVLHYIREECSKRKSCEGCPCAGLYVGVRGRQYYCTIQEVPDKWQTDIIRDNLKQIAESEE